MKGKIYKIVNEDLNLTYYGSTTKKYLASRIAQHKYQSKKCINKFITSSKLFSTNNYKACIVEEIEFENIKQLREREKYYIENFDCVNKQIPNLTKKQTQKKYREKNKDTIKSYYQDVLKERRKTQFKYCDICNIDITANNFSSHKKTKKHLKKCITIVNAKDSSCKG